MQNHWKSHNSHHKISLTSLTKDFIANERSLPTEGPQIQIHQNEVHIKNTLNYDRRRATQDEIYKRIFNELTKKVRLYKVKGFDKLSLSFSQCEDISDDFIQYLKKIIIQNFSDIKSLALNFYKNVFLSENSLELLADFISNFKNLRSLQIRLLAFRQIHDDPLADLIERIHASHKRLKNLHIDISTYRVSAGSRSEPPRSDLFERVIQHEHRGSHGSSQNKLSKNGILQANYLITQYFNTLQELNLNFSHSANKKITDQTCQELGQRILERMDRLKRLTLDFSGCGDLTNEAMRLFSEKKKRLINLEYLTLELARVNIDDIGLKLLEEGIGTQFKGLKGLVLNFMSNNEITGEGLEGLNKGIVQNLQSLQAYTLAGFWSKKISSKSVKSISKDICKNLKNLKELVLMFSEMDTTVLPAISLDLEENLLNLDKLSLMLKIDASYPETFKLDKLPHVLRTTLKGLIELNLDFNGHNSELNNEAIMELGKSLEGLAKLKRLALVFDGCSKIGQYDKVSDFRLGVLVPKDVMLEKFEAGFGECSRIKEEHLDEFGASLCEFQKELRVISVNFSWCEQLREESYKKLCYGIKHDMKKLEELTLNFYECEEISREAKTEMKALFKEVPLANLY